MELLDYIEVMETPNQVIRAIDYFIGHLREDHQVPGKVWYTLNGIGDWAKQHGFVSDKQFSYVYYQIQQYHDELDYFV